MNESELLADSSLSAPDRWVEEYGDYLFKHALIRLRDRSKAEDVVQETFLVALKSAGSFAGRSAAKSWLLGILKNKICDYYRKAGRESSFSDLDFYSDQEREAFVSSGLWQGEWSHESGPSDWREPGANLDREAFWKAFQECASKMSKKTSAVFTLRELDGMNSKEICSTLGISEKNLWVMLHRARMALRRCLEVTWFKKQK